MCCDTIRKVVDCSTENQQKVGAVGMEVLVGVLLRAHGSDLDTSWMCCDTIRKVIDCSAENQQKVGAVGMEVLVEFLKPPL
jgi:hypothetical protein